jgi:ribosomal RNA assembly protein
MTEMGNPAQKSMEGFEMNEIIRIPEERVKILIGKNGKTKKMLEKRCRIRLKIEDGDIVISGEPTDIFFASDVIKAIGRGFEPRKALLLLKDEYMFYLIPLREVVSSDKAITRLKGRIIGEKGSIRLRIEEATESFISVYGSTIAIIAKVDTIEYAKEAVSMIISGARHSSVLAYLSKAKKEIMDSKFRA